MGNLMRQLPLWDTVAVDTESCGEEVVTSSIWAKGYNFQNEYKEIARVEHGKWCKGYPIYSVCFVCPICLDVWGFICTNRSDLYIPQMTSCQWCGWGDDWSPVEASIIQNGTINDGVNWTLLEVLPKELLKIELIATIDAYFKGRLK